MHSKNGFVPMIPGLTYQKLELSSRQFSRHFLTDHHLTDMVRLFAALCGLFPTESLV